MSAGQWVMVAFNAAFWAVLAGIVIVGRLVNRQRIVQVNPVIAADVAVVVRYLARVKSALIQPSRRTVLRTLPGRPSRRT